MRTLPTEPTARQQAVLDAVAAYANEHGHGPSLRDLGKALGVAHTTVWKHLRYLARKGFVVAPEATWRAVRTANKR